MKKTGKDWGRLALAFLMIGLGAICLLSLQYEFSTALLLLGVLAIGLGGIAGLKFFYPVFSRGQAKKVKKKNNFTL